MFVETIVREKYKMTASVWSTYPYTKCTSNIEDLRWGNNIIEAEEGVEMLSLKCPPKTDKWTAK